MTEPDTTFSFSSQRLTLTAASWGEEHLPPLILVHGGRDQKRSWDAVAQDLSARYRVFVYDLRGHGTSDWVSDGAYSIMDHVFDLASLVEHLELDRFTLMGHSLGGNIVLRYAGLFPEKIEKCVAIEGLGPSPKMLEEREAQSYPARAHEWITQRRLLSQRVPRVMATLTEAQSRMAAAFPHLPETLIHHLTRTGIKTHSDGTVSWAYDPAGMGRTPADIPRSDIEALWTAITCPVWLVYGATSWASNPAKDGRAAHFRQAIVTVVAEAGHWVHHDKFNVFMDGLRAFLND